MAENLNLKTVNTVDTRPFKKLVMTIGELPTSFIESMTYYELLAWFTNYLETVIIPAVNNNAEATEELQTLFTELRSYVDNYFDNLDVQDEIDNKLDAMVEAGTLQEIVADYLNSRAVFGFDVVADMIAATNLQNGSYARTLGYYNRNDGGDGLYRIRTVTNDDINNPFVIEMADDNLVAELVHYKRINILQLGAKADGSTNISTIVNSIITNYDVYIPQGNYLVESSINITRNHTYFECKGNLIIDDIVGINLNASYCDININTISNSNFNGTAIKYKTNSASDTSIAYNNLNIKNIEKTNIGILLAPEFKGVQYNKFNFNLIRANYCIELNTGNDNASGAASGWVNENTFNGGRCMGGTGVYMLKGPNQSDAFNNNKFYSIAFEEIENPIVMQNGLGNYFGNMRLVESITGTYHINVDANSKENKFENTNYLYTTKILDGNTSNNRPNIYEPVRDASGNIATSCKFLSGKPVVNNKMWQTDSMTNIYNQDTATIDRNCYYNGMLISVGIDSGRTTVLTLPDVFADNGVTDFYLRVSFRGTNASITVKNSSGNDIVTNNDIGTDTTDSLSNKYYHVVKLNSSLTLTGLNNKWIVTKLN